MMQWYCKNYWDKGNKQHQKKKVGITVLTTYKEESSENVTATILDLHVHIYLKLESLWTLLGCIFLPILYLKGLFKNNKIDGYFA